MRPRVCRVETQPCDLLAWLIRRDAESELVGRKDTRNVTYVSSLETSPVGATESWRVVAALPSGQIIMEEMRHARVEHAVEQNRISNNASFRS